MLTFAEARDRLENFISHQPDMADEVDCIKAILADIEDRLNQIKANMSHVPKA